MPRLRRDKEIEMSDIGGKFGGAGDKGDDAGGIESCI
jgi:hypothetical protein